jgi:hypothetical protein
MRADDQEKSFSGVVETLPEPWPGTGRVAYGPWAASLRYALAETLSGRTTI